MNCFCGMVDRRKTFNLISSRECQRSSPSRISNTSRAAFEPAQNLSLGFVEWSCAVVITTSDNSAIVRKLFQAPLQITYWLTLQKRGQKPYIDRKLIWKLGGLKIIILLTLQCFILKIKWTRTKRFILY